MSDNPPPPLDLPEWADQDENDILSAIAASVTRTTSRCEIFEPSDSLHFDHEGRPLPGALWMSDAPLISGSVNVSVDRPERRSCDLLFHNDDGALNNFPGGFWYDKIIRPYRGIVLPDGRLREAPLGTFMVDDIGRGHHPRTVSVKGRDYMKRFLVSLFNRPFTFFKNAPAWDLISHLFENARHPENLVEDHSDIKNDALDHRINAERGDNRYETMLKYLTPRGYIPFLDRWGFLRFRGARDPITAPTRHRLHTGFTWDEANLVTYDKSANDSRIYNTIIITGEATNENPVWARARNTDPDSPTNVDKLGERVHIYSSPHFKTRADCLSYAQDLLEVYALESFDLNFSSLVIYWMSVNEILEFHDPYVVAGDPDRFYLTDLTIPCVMGNMTGTARRVVPITGEYEESPDPELYEEEEVP